MVQSRHSLLTALVVTTVAVTVALTWAGWRLLNQQRLINEQRAADGIAAAIRSKLAETGEKLSAALADPQHPSAVPDGVVLTVRPDGAAIATAGPLPFVPKTPESSADEAVFAEGQALEFAQADLAGAASRYRMLVTNADPEIRAEAWLRLGRVALNSGDTETALKAYRQLVELGDVRIQQLPANFVGLYQQRAIALLRGEADVARHLTDALVDGLNDGKWLLNRGQVESYRDALSAAIPPTLALAEALDRLWTIRSGRFSQRGQVVFADGARSVLVMWRGGGSGTAFLASFLDAFLPPVLGTSWQLTDPEGRWMAGDRTLASTSAPSRLLGDAEFPWTLRVSGTTAAGVSSESTLLAMMAAMLVFLWGAMYLMARAIRREAVVVRLQSDFVNAVSHEFRSPLTTIRQMTEMLEIGRLPSEERRQAYYSVLTSEAARLQRLVETLLHFGRMEAGAARYRLEEIDVAVLVRDVVGEVAATTHESGTRIDVGGAESGVWVRADRTALSLAVRNLIDNAIKYSPGQAVVRIALHHADGHASVAVIDQGMGIPRHERQQIFEKFVRGREAIDRNVAGTGVGLAMVRQIVAAHAGEITVESEVGKGSTFTLVVPLINSQLPRANSQEAVVRP